MSACNSLQKNLIKLLPLFRCVLLLSESHGISPTSSMDILLCLVIPTSTFKHRLPNRFHPPPPTRLAPSQLGSTAIYKSTNFLSSRSSVGGKDRYWTIQTIPIKIKLHVNPPPGTCEWVSDETISISSVRVSIQQIRKCMFDLEQCLLTAGLHRTIFALAWFTKPLGEGKWSQSPF